ncbi:phosphatase PAP2 family protein [Burkholderia ubonensis]|uniref:phosphatase PAP2 family protein n=1 Tax=Burkholderia ubonensis TaxID=101571 RepID=UPI000AF1FD93|nr:phosphatase PAP2 family protein [Burkholderia ubonensis]
MNAYTCWARRAGFTIDAGDVAQFARAVAIGLGIAALLATVSCIPRYRKLTRTFRYREVSLAFLCVTLLAVFSQAALVSTYLCIALAPPTIEAGLVRLDAALGFHWPDLYRRVRARADLQAALGLAYRSVFAQVLGIPFILAALRRLDDLVEFVALFALSSLVVIAIATPFPAESAFVHFGIADAGTASTVSHFDLLRSGQLTHIHPLNAQGLVSLPSFHKMMALYFAYAIRHVRVVLPVAVLANIAMILSTPTQGGHYLVDVIAGLVVGALSIVAARRWLTGARRIPFRALGVSRST